MKNVGKVCGNRTKIADILNVDAEENSTAAVKDKMATSVAGTAFVTYGNK